MNLLANRFCVALLISRSTMPILKITYAFKKYLISILLRIKWQRHNARTHRENLLKKRFISPSEHYDLPLKPLLDFLLGAYSGYINLDGKKLYFHPAAAISINQSIEEYLKYIGPKSRNMIKKAEKCDYYFGGINWNSCLGDIYEINTSISSRQGREMSSSYKEYPRPINYSESNYYSIETLGVFKKEKLVAYCEVYLYGRIATINRILGHKAHLTFGIMNLLIYAVFLLCKENKASFLLYLAMNNRSKNSLSAFKQRVGFSEYTILEK